MAKEEKAPIGLALSGGGHRATLFALGALLYLSDSAKSKGIASISSVSGGSIVNAFLYLMEKPITDLEAPEFDEYAARLARQISGRPVYFWVSLVAYLASFILFFIDLLLNWPIRESGQIYLVAASVAPLIISVILGPRSLGTLWSWWGSWAYVGSIFAIVLLAFWLPMKLWMQILVVVAALVLTIFRPIIASIAIGRSIEFCSGWRERYDDCAPVAGHHSSPVHVFCATDMHDGEHLFVSTSDVVFSPSFGIGTTGNLKLRTIVEASANFPGAFPPRILMAGRHSFEADVLFAERRRVGPALSDEPSPFRTLVLVDGGIRDNLALTWYFGRSQLVKYLNSRAEQAKELNELSERTGAGRQPFVKDPDRMLELTSKLSIGKADHVVAINAAYTPAAWSIPMAWVPIIGELYSYLSLPKVMYHRSNRQVVLDFRQKLFSGSIKGAMIAIEDTPINTAGFIAEGYSYFNFPSKDDDFEFSSLKESAEEVMEYDIEILCGFLGNQIARSSPAEKWAANRRYFRNLVASCRDEGTHLNPMGKKAAAKLLFHGYTTAMTNLHILSSEYPLMDATPTLSDFAALAGGMRREATPQFMK